MIFLQENYQNNFTQPNNQKAGFTLMEMMVVITIIGILSAIALASLNSARESARDSQRRADLDIILVGLSSYAADHSTYQVENAGSHGQGWFNYEYSNEAVADVLVQQGYLSKIFHDPLLSSTVYTENGHSGYMIYQVENGWTAGVCLFAQLENPSDEDLATMDNIEITGGTSWLNTLQSSYNMNYAACN